MPMAEAKQITFTVENSKAVMADINTDAARVQEMIILNPLTNGQVHAPGRACGTDYRVSESHAGVYLR